MGNFTAIGDVGRIGITSGITFLIAYIGWRTSTLIQAGVALVLFFWLFHFVMNKHEEKTEVKNVHVSIKEFIKNKKFLFSTIAGFFDSFASSGLFIFLPFLLLFRGVDPKILGSFTAAYFVGNFLGKSVLGRLADKFSTTTVFIISEILMAIFIIVLANTPSFFIIIVSSVILGIFTKGTTPIVQTMVSESVEHHGNYEKAFGLKMLVSGAGSALAPLALGFLSNKYGVVSAFNMSAVFALVAIIPAIGFKFNKSET
jgi:predicted MFS family arabinose efflux permease